MERFEWDDSLNVRVRDIDEQKTRISAHINRIFEAWEEEASNKDLFDLINELGEGLRMHFAHEERIMNELEYPELQEQKKAHKYFLRKTLNLRRVISDTPETLADESFSFLMEWLKQHILDQDQRFAPYARVRLFSEAQKRSRRMR